MAKKEKKVPNLSEHRVYIVFFHKHVHFFKKKLTDRMILIGLQREGQAEIR